MRQREANTQKKIPMKQLTKSANISVLRFFKPKILRVLYRYTNGNINVKQLSDNNEVNSNYIYTYIYIIYNESREMTLESKYKLKLKQYPFARLKHAVVHENR